MAQTTKPLLVKKFGGAVLSTPEKIKAVAQGLAKESEKYNLIVAVSAMGTTTNDLLKLAHAVSPVPNRRELDLLLTVGERISMSLLSMALNDLGCPAVSFTGSQAGIITEDLHGEAQIVEIRSQRMDEALSKGKIVIIAGYQGMSRTTKEVTTLGRGGTDITAVALAGHFKALRCEILKEVPGVMSADPRLVPSAQPLQYVSYHEFMEMTVWGAKVLNYRAAKLAEEKRVPLWIGPVGELDKHVTQVGEKSLNENRDFSVNSHASVLALEADTSTKDIPESLLQFALQKGLSPLHLLHTAKNISYATGPEESLNEWQSILNTASQSPFKLKDVLSSITLTGEKSKKVFGKVASTVLHNEAVHSDHSISLLLAKEKRDIVLKDLHHLIEKE